MMGFLSLPVAVILTSAGAQGIASDAADKPAVAVVVARVPERIAPYPLPKDAKERLLALAARSDVLILGEIHGSQEVPRILATLLPDLAKLGYRGLALEVGADHRDGIEAWARGADGAPIPPMYARPPADGRGNVETLALLRSALGASREGGAGASSGGDGWRLLCFDVAPAQARPGPKWAERDAFMAANLAEQRRRLCPGGRVVAVCGNMHSRLENTLTFAGAAEYWPSFAANLRDANPALAVNSVSVVPHGGTFYNNGAVQQVGDAAGKLTAVSVEAEPEGSHTLTLHIPAATAATFLADPAAPGR
jgi:erythromycin esterase-like protein